MAGRRGVAIAQLPSRMKAVDYLQLVAAHPSLASSRGMSRGNAEEQLHRDCFAWVQDHEAKFPILKRMFHPANGGARSKGEGGKLKAMGVRPGVPDFLLPLPNGRWLGLAIELKASDGVVSSVQSEWLTDFRQVGYLVGVARTLMEFEALVLTFLG